MKKRILSILLTACMLMSLFPLVLSAEAINPTPTTPLPNKTYENTVYLANGGDDNNDGSDTAPVATLAKAVELLATTGGEIVVVDDVTQTSTESTWRINLAENTQPIYIHGAVNDNGEYSTLTLNCSTTGGATILNLGGALVFYDITLATTVNSANLWICTNGHSLTIGENVTTKTNPNADGTVGVAKIVNGSHGTGTVTGNAVTNIYSGNWGEVYATSYNKTAVQQGGTVNIYGGNVIKLTTVVAGSTAINGNIVVNYYGGSVNSLYAYDTARCLSNFNIFAETLPEPTYYGTFSSYCDSIINRLYSDSSDFKVPTAVYGKTVYMSKNGSDTNDGRTTTSAVATLEKATALLGELGGEIVVLDDITQAKTASGTYQINLAEHTGTIYIHGVENNGSYSSLTCTSAANGTGVMLVFNGPVVIYDLNLKAGRYCNFFLLTGGHSFTIGRNVTTTRSKNASGAYGTFQIIAGRHNSGSTKTLAGGDTPIAASTSIYSGVWENVYVTSQIASHTQPGGTLNVCGESEIGTVTTEVASSAATGSVTVNYYGGKISSITGNTTEDITRTDTLNILSTSVTAPSYSGVFADGTNVDSSKTGAAPEFKVEYYRTVYMASNGLDTNDGLTKETAVATIEKATELLSETGGEIVVLDDITQKSKFSHTWHVDLAANKLPIYVHGIQKSDGTYTSLKFDPLSDEGHAALLEMEGPMIFYDIVLGSPQFTCNFWIVTNGYELTVGRNVTVDTYTGNNGVGVSKIINGRFDADNDNTSNIGNANAVTNIYSGEWSEIYATSYDKAATQNGGTVNVYGGEITYIYNTGKSDNTAVTGNIVINYYASTATTLKGYAATGRTQTLKNYNGAQISVNTPWTKSDAEGTAPAFVAQAHQRIVYISREGKDTNDGLTKETAVATLVKATEILGWFGGEIVVLDDITQSSTSTTWHIELPANSATIYIHGVKKSDDTYTALMFDAKQNGSTPLVHIQGPIVVYDITVGTSRNNSNFWFVTNGYSLTIGRNVTTKNSGTGASKIINGSFAADKGYPDNTAATTNAITNIHSGTWGEVYATSRYDAATQAGGIVNIYGGTITKVIMENSASATNVTGDIVVNYWAGTLSEITGFDSENVTRTNTLNIMSALITAPSYSGVFENGGTGIITDYSVAVEFDSPANIEYVGVQETGKYTVNETEVYSIRFVGVIRGTEDKYDEIGFNISTYGSTGVFEYGDQKRTTIYETIHRADGEVYTADDLGGDYIFELPIYNIPTSIGEISVNVQPYAVINGIKYLSKAFTVVYDAGEYQYTTDASSITMMSLNLRNPGSTTADEYNDSTVGVAARAEVIAGFVGEQMPDSIGVQECEDFWKTQLDSKLSSLGYVSAHDTVYYTNSTTGTKTLAFKNYIYYNSETTTCLNSGTIWLNGKGTMYYENAVKSGDFYISAAWAVFVNNKTGEQYVHINTHLNSGSDTLRATEINHLLDKVEEFTGAGYRVFITGDFNEDNSGSEGSVYATVKNAKFTDARDVAISADTMNTYNGYSDIYPSTNYREQSQYTLKDYCFYNGNGIKINSFDVVDKWNDSFLSDHNALLIEFTLTSEVQQ